MTILDDRGIFWWNDEDVPDKNFAPEGSIGGKLTIDDNGSVRLELDGIMPSDNHPFEALVNSGQDINRNIQGLLTNTGHVLLMNMFKSGGTVRTDNVSREKYVARQCLVSQSAFPRDRNAPIKYSAITIDLKGYESWMWLKSINITRQRNSLIAKYKAPRDRTFILPFGKLYIEHDLLGPYLGHHHGRELALKEIARLNLRLSKSISTGECLKYYQIAQDLLIILTSSDYSLDWPDVIIQGKKQSAKLYFMHVRSDAKPPEAHECIISFPKIADSFGDLYAAMVERREQYGPGIYLYLATRRGMKMIVEHRFVNLIWGLEALNRQDAGASGTEVNMALANKIQRILSQISAKRDRDWLQGKLRHASEPSLSERLLSIFSGLPLPFNEAALKNFCIECQSRRNDISHFGGHREMGKTYDQFMHDISKKSDALSALYHLHLLTLIGVDKERFELATNHNWAMTKIEWALRAVGLLIPKDERPTTDHEL